MTGDLIAKYGYIGIILLLVLGGLGVPIPEEAPVVLSAILSHKGSMIWWLALLACFTGVLLGDFVVYFLGYYYGEKVLSFRLTRKFLTRPREEQIKGYFHRHGVKILIVGRFAVGFRTAAYLTAGILRLPALRLLLADLFAASLSTLLMFGLGYLFADRVEAGFRELKHYLVVLAFVVVVAWVGYSYYKARKRAGQLVGPPVLIEPDQIPLPPDDLHSGLLRLPKPAAEPPAPPPEGGDVVPAFSPIPVEPPDPRPRRCLPTSQPARRLSSRRRRAENHEKTMRPITIIPAGDSLSRNARPGAMSWIITVSLRRSRGAIRPSWRTSFAMRPASANVCCGRTSGTHGTSTCADWRRRRERGPRHSERRARTWWSFRG